MQCYFRVRRKTTRSAQSGLWLWLLPDRCAVWVKNTGQGIACQQVLSRWRMIIKEGGCLWLFQINNKSQQQTPLCKQLKPEVLSRSRTCLGISLATPEILNLEFAFFWSLFIAFWNPLLSALSFQLSALFLFPCFLNPLAVNPLHQSKNNESLHFHLYKEVWDIKIIF